MDSLILLNVPFDEKDEAKMLGARWNPVLKSWFIPQGKDSSIFAKWLPAVLEQKAILQAIPPIYLMMASENCWRCGENTDVFCVGAAGFSEEARLMHDFVIFSNLQVCEEQLGELLRRYAPRYRMAHSKPAGEYYFMNHCACCNAKMGDFYMHNEPEGAFCPINESQAGAVTLFELTSLKYPISLAASVGNRSPCYLSLYGTHGSLF